jgi:hypothetical protein
MSSSDEKLKHLCLFTSLFVGRAGATGVFGVVGLGYARALAGIGESEIDRRCITLKVGFVGRRGWIIGRWFV